MNDSRQPQDDRWIAGLISGLQERIAKLEAQIGPVQMILYGLVAIVMTSVIVALMAFVLGRH